MDLENVERFAMMQARTTRSPSAGQTTGQHDLPPNEISFRHEVDTR
jgi:hypothetical protein